MSHSSPVFGAAQPRRPIGLGDGLAVAGVAVVVYAGVRLALGAPATVRGPEISLAPAALPWYAVLSTGRMLAAYILSLLFCLLYGRVAASSRTAEALLVPLLDVLQSVPVLSFLPVVLLGLSVIVPQGVAAELAAIVLIFTSQAWNLTFVWYQSLTTVPKELREASRTFRFGAWLRFRTLELPFAGIGLIWNSMMSWAGGWFFLMAAEFFRVGARDFRLPGLGTYLQEAANQGDTAAIVRGLATLVLVIVLLDQFVWRPLLAWSDRFKLEMVRGEPQFHSWFYEAMRASRLTSWLGSRVWRPLSEALDGALTRLYPPASSATPVPAQPWRRLLALPLLAVLAYGAFHAARMLLLVPPGQWLAIGSGLLATLVRVLISLAIALAWTVPTGVAIGTSPKVAAVLQPVVQVVASIPATALFPVFLIGFLRLPAGLDLAAVFLMLAGTQWYLLFNIIAGASAIPQDLKYTAAMLGLSRRGRWRTLILPALFPYIITGAITAGGGAWNASIVAEHVSFAGQDRYTTGIGALIARATGAGDYPLLLAATLSMIVAVVALNRLVWRRLYGLAEDKYRME